MDSHSVHRIPIAPESGATSTLSRATLIVNMRPWLLRFFRRRTANESDAEDLAHETLARALDNPAWQHPDQAAPYISRVAANLHRDEIRKHKVRHEAHAHAPELTSELIEEITPERQLAARQTVERVLEVLQKMSARTRDIFLRHRIHDTKQATIAEDLGVCVSTIEKQIRTATRHLSHLEP